MPRSRPAHLAVLAALVAALGVAAAVVPASAAAQKPCWKQLINDWYDGRIDKSYTVRCYRQALDNLPEDVETYSSAREDIERALRAAARRNLRPNQLIPPQAGTARPRNTGGNTTTTGTDQTETTAGGEPGEGGGTAGGGPVDNDPLGSFSPKNADSLPLPLLVLAGLALLLLAAAGASFIARRLQERRPPLSPPPPESQRP